MEEVAWTDASPWRPRRVRRARCRPLVATHGCLSRPGRPPRPRLHLRRAASIPTEAMRHGHDPSGEGVARAAWICAESGRCTARAKSDPRRQRGAEPPNPTRPNRGKNQRNGGHIPALPRPHLRAAGARRVRAFDCSSSVEPAAVTLELPPWITDHCRVSPPLSVRHERVPSASGELRSCPAPRSGACLAARVVCANLKV